MDPVFDRCELCSLPLRYGTVQATFLGKPVRFCCKGCRQVYAMLLEAGDEGNPADFKNTELFRRCRDLGVIPRTEVDLERQTRAQIPAARARVEPAEIAKSRPKELLQLNLVINGMWCPACAWVIEETLRKKPGVADPTCNFSTDRLRCSYDPVRISPQQIMESIEQLGYSAALAGSDALAYERRKEIIRLVISVFLTANVMMLSFAVYSGFFSELTRDAVLELSIPIWIMASVVLFYGGHTILTRAWRGAASAAYSMETLIALGSLSAYSFSVYNVFGGSIHIYFDTASMLITLVLVGKFLESRAKDRIQDDLRNFLALVPTKVRICSADYPQGRYVSSEHLQNEDVFRIDENEIVPADAVIIEGTGIVDESSVTGEAARVKRKPGDRLKSGTKITHGMLKAKAIAVGGASILGQMVEVFEKALEKKTPLEGKTDRILQWFVPVIVLLALGTGAWCYLSGLTAEQSLMRAITVIVISCPCALGVAIPLARVAGISAAGKNGIVVRDFSSFEQAEKINAFVFDKTGTITKGQWSLRNIEASGAYSEHEVVALAAGLEKESDHTIARAIRERAQAMNVKPASLTAITQHENGIVGILNGDRVKIGSSNFVGYEENGHGSPHDGSSKIYLSNNGTVCAFFEFGDIIRESVASGVKELARRGYELSLVSGDGAAVTKLVAKRVGIEDAHGGLLPHEKAEFVAGKQNRGHCVAMVGDGVNDAPALVQADLAIAIHGETSLTKEAADVTLMRGKPIQILDFLGVANRVNRKVFQNLFLSSLYNAVSIPIAMSGLLTPLVAVAAMILSSLSVTGNTLLLARKNI